MHSWQICSPHSQVQQKAVCCLQQQHSYCCFRRRRVGPPIFPRDPGLGSGIDRGLICSPYPAQKLRSC
jgi:hypothetical protein